MPVMKSNSRGGRQRRYISYKRLFVSRDCCNKRSRREPETKRQIRANDPEFNTSFDYAQNHITTSKYTVLTFLPINLFEQFQRLANAYFLMLLILQLVPWISSLSPITTVVPLVSVLTFTAIKDAYDDIQRHASDNQVNTRETSVMRDRSLVTERWDQVRVGDIIKMTNNQFVAADLLLLSSSEPNSLCYIETAELDGETNLKVRQALPEVAVLSNDEKLLSNFKGEIECEPPNNRLTKFQGTLYWNDQSFSLDNDKILLRGCILRNTEWCYGLVIFAGPETKLMQNCGKAPFKRTHIERLMNLLVIGILVYLLLTCILAMLGQGIWEVYWGQYFRTYLPWEEFVPTDSVHVGATVISLMVFWSYIIILNTFVPISLYVSVEIIRFSHSMFINWDRKMYFEPLDIPAKARTTTLNEELGQIEYIFSDKTGTLTQNIMEFKKCSIAGELYGEQRNKEGMIFRGELSSAPLVDLSWNEQAEAKFEFRDELMVERLRHGSDKASDDIKNFFKLLSLCHTVMPESGESKIIHYQAQSPDEGALVSAARNFGFAFKSRTPNTITIDVLGETETHDLLCILDFNNVRKRMSVVTRYQGQIRLFCKGADSLVYERLDSRCNEMADVTQQHLNDFAQDGLRTLVLGYKLISEEEWEAWSVKHHEASTSLENRDELLHECYEEIEQNMMLLGATAIEDKLQEGVPEAIEKLEMAGIKVWVLTGDKQETAVNIGYSCNLLSDTMADVFIVDADSEEEVKKQLEDALQCIEDFQESPHRCSVDTVDQDPESEASFALVINGHSLVHALEPALEKTLLSVGSQCASVICCRVTPLQKALVVDLIKRNKSAVTLAIGDGANDVSMLKAAHIGVGISGQEGLQAVLASDYALGQFCYLERLLLVHGRWSYYRMCKFLRYFFYKNFAFTLCHLWFGFFCGFSAQTLFDPLFITSYNLFYTAMPVLCMAVFDQDVSDVYSLRYPKLYTPGLRNELFNKKMFVLSVGEGILASIVMFFVPYLAYAENVTPDGRDLADMNAFGVSVAGVLAVTVNLRCALDTVYWTGFNHFVILASTLLFFLASVIVYSDTFQYSFVGTDRTIMSTPTFWFSLLLAVVLLMVPILLYRVYMLTLHPTLTDRLRLRQHIVKSKSRHTDLAMRVRKAIRGTRRSRRSGYAFSHSEGFGRLITSGLNMRLPKVPSMANIKKSLSRLAGKSDHNGLDGASGSRSRSNSHHQTGNSSVSQKQERSSSDSQVLEHPSCSQSPDSDHQVTVEINAPTVVA